MSNDLNYYKKAKSLTEFDNAIRFTVPVTPSHEFYTDFSDVRGDFEDKLIYRTLNVNPKTFTFNSEANRGNKVTLFLAGMRGSGKTTELAKISAKLNSKDCFFCVTCNLDDGLDLNDMEYMDILIFQLERLFQEIEAKNIELSNDIINSLYSWFGERVKEVNKMIKSEGGFEVGIEASTPSLLLSFLGITAKLKAGLAGSKENADKIRTTFKNNFTTFANKFNEFVEHVNIVLRNNDLAKEVLFIVDGLEKVATMDIRKKIVLDEANRIKQIKANTIFTLPIELYLECQRLLAFAHVVSFPFVKIREKDGTIVEEAIKRFETFIYNRIDPSLFDSPQTVREAILYGGGSPRELLRVLEYAYLFADEDTGKILRENLDKGVKKLAAQTSQFVSTKNLEKLKTLKKANENKEVVPFDEEWQDLLEKLIVLEYNDGTYKRVNPIVEVSDLYKQNVK